MGSIVVVGACCLDTILSVSHYPAEDDKLRASSVARRRGGNCGNTAEVLAQLLAAAGGAPPSATSLVLLCVLPARCSPATAQVVASFPPGVDVSRCVFREGFEEAASSYIVRSRRTSSRTIVNFNELPEMDAAEFTSTALALGADAGWYHFEGRIPDTTRECILCVRRCNPSARVSVEVEKPGREGLRGLAELADIVFYSRGWAEGSGYQSPEECLRSEAPQTPNASVLFCTWGDEGASALELPALVYTRRPAFASSGLRVVDTIGAGDTFIAGILFAMSHHAFDWTTAQKLEFANECAGRKVGQHGFSNLGPPMERYF